MKKVTQVDIARIARVERSTVSRIINNDSRFSYSEATRQRIFKAASQIGYLHPAISQPRRRAPRKKLKARALIRICLPDGTLYSECRGEVVDISSTGMLLRTSSGGQMPTASFYLEITLTNAKLRLKALPIRCTPEDKHLAFGVRFLDALKQQQLRKLVS